MESAHELALLVLLEDPGVREAAYLRALETHDGLEIVVRCLEVDPDRGVCKAALGSVVNELMEPERRIAIMDAMPAGIVDEDLRERVRWLNFCDQPGASLELCPKSPTELSASPDWVQRRIVQLQATPRWILDFLSDNARTKTVRNTARQRAEGQRQG